MANDTGVDDGAINAFRHLDDTASAFPGSSLARLTNFAGAVLSVTLIAGIGVWGYKLMMRDVTGIPIIRAVEGDMRVRPDDPGGELARHQGLSVNAVTAEGGAEAPAERLVLAPQPVALTEEDMPIDGDAVAIVQQAVADQTVTTTDQATGFEATDDQVVVEPGRVAAATEAGSVEDLLNTLTDDVAPHTRNTAGGGPETLVQAAATSADIRNAVAAALGEGDGMRASLRPQLRPAGLRDTSVSGAAPPAAYDDLDADSLPAGTRLVQLGAYDTAQVARAEWNKVFARFADLMADKDRVVQQASSGGRDFFRLRVAGFDDLADARRFCAAILADGADCIPVVTR